MSIRVITSCYTDTDLLDTWIPILEQQNIPFLIYYKEDSFKKGDVQVIDKNRIRIPNYGRCDYAFLYHIIENYDQLDNVTVFVKNNWNQHYINLWKHIEMSTEYDFMESGTIRKFQHWTPNIITPYPRDEEIYSNYHPFAQTTMDWYHEIFPNTPPPTVVAGWGMGPCFSVSKRLIHRHPKSVYEHLLQKFYPESGSWDIEKAKAVFPTIEEQLVDIGKHYHDCLLRFWYVLFTHDIEPHKYIIYQNWSMYDE